VRLLEQRLTARAWGGAQQRGVVISLNRALYFRGLLEMIVIDSSNPFGSGEDRKVLFAARAVNYDKSQIGFRV